MTIRVNFTALAVVAAACLGLSAVTQACAQQLYVTYPSISSPTSFEDCDRFEEDWTKLQSDIDQRHQSCLDTSRSPSRYTGSDPDSPVCSHAECQYLHDARREVKKQAEERVAQCRREVREYLAQFEGCIPGCKAWNLQRGLGGEPVCRAMVYCHARPTTPPDALDRAPVAPRPR